MKIYDCDFDYELLIDGYTSNIYNNRLILPLNNYFIFFYLFFYYFQFFVLLFYNIYIIKYIFFFKYFFKKVILFLLILFIFLFFLFIFSIFFVKKIENINKDVYKKIDNYYEKLKKIEQDLI